LINFNVNITKLINKMIIDVYSEIIEIM